MELIKQPNTSLNDAGGVQNTAVQGRRMLSTREGILFSLRKKRGERYLAFADDVLC